MQFSKYLLSAIYMHANVHMPMCVFHLATYLFHITQTDKKKVTTQHNCVMFMSLNLYNFSLPHCNVSEFTEKSEIVYVYMQHEVMKRLRDLSSGINYH